MIKRNFIVLLNFFLLSCTSSNIETLSPVDMIKDSNSGILFSQVRHIQGYQGDFYFNDYNNNRILKADSSLNLVRAFGESGKGPGEFQGAGYMSGYDDFLYIFDGGGMRINVFTLNGKFYKTVSVSSHIGGRFTISKNKIYFPPLDDPGTDILVMKLNGTLVKKIKSDDKNHDFYNYRNLLTFKDQIISVDLTSPFIHRYSASGEILEEFDLTKIKALQSLWDYYFEKQALDNSQNTALIFEDAYISNSSLYVLCAPWPERDNYSYIIKLSLDEGKIKVQNLFKIQGTNSKMRLFGSLAIEGERLIAIERYSEQVFEFDLSRLE